MSNVKRQKTLGFFGFTKSVTHRGEKMAVKIPDEIEDFGIKKYSCSTCSKQFLSNQGLGVHKLSCEKKSMANDNVKPLSNKMSSINTNSSDIKIIESVVKSVTNNLVNLVEKNLVDIAEVEKKTNEKNKKETRGRDIRRSHTALFKATVIHELQPGVTQDQVADKYHVSQSLISKWCKEKDSIIAAATDKHKKLYAKQRKSTKYIDLYKALFEELKKARGKGLKVNFNWLWSKARTLHRKMTNTDSAVIKKHVVTTFLNRFNVRMRSRQRNKNKPKEAYRNDLMKWHSITRERLIRTGAHSESFSNKWGRFPPSQRFNLDQSPMPFVVDQKKTYEIIKPGEKHHKTWISQPASGLDKRQCTLQICIRGDSEQPRIAIIFRGTGKRVRQDEQNAWHPDVDVLWQENAWADTACSVEWVNKTLKSAAKTTEKFVLFVDNLTAQQTEEFKDAVAGQNGIVWYGLRNATDLWQVVDAGIAQTLKVLVGHNYQQWLDEGENADLWFGLHKGLSAMQRRILITHWVGNAWKRLCGPEYTNLRARCWEKTGCLMTADGSEDHRISPEGLPDYKIPPPILYLPTCESEPQSNSPDGHDDSVEEDDVLDEDRNQPDDHGTEWVDKEEDRSTDDELCGRMLKVFYNNGWFVGEIEYFNNIANKYRVSYKDDTEDYIGIEEIDGIEVILMDS